MPTQPQLASQLGATAVGAFQPAAETAETALVQSSASPVSGVVPPIGALISRFPVEIDVAVPIRKFRVRDLLTLSKGVVIVSQWVQGEDLPLAAPGAQLAWSEFEVIDQKLAVRITRLV
jgi:flagellar motor switch protein FliN/FliY